MPIAIVLTLAPSEDVTLPAFLGRAAHAWFLDQMRNVSPALNRALHVPNVRRPFTVSSLWTSKGRVTGDRRQLKAGQLCYLRITSVAEDVTAVLKAELAPRWLAAKVILGGAMFQVRAVADTAARHPQAATLSYAALRKMAEDASVPTRITLRFLTPTTFRRSSPKDSRFAARTRNVPLPQPELVFGSLLATWQTFAPTAMPEDLAAFVRECVVLNRYQLHTERVTFGSGRRGTVGGFVGRCRFALSCSDATLQRAVGVLSAFAPFAGVGWRTTMGLGQVEYPDHSRAKSPAL